MEPLTCWDCGFESSWGYGLSVVSAVFCQRFLRRTDHSSRGGPGPLGVVAP